MVTVIFCLFLLHTLIMFNPFALLSLSMYAVHALYQSQLNIIFAVAPRSQYLCLFVVLSYNIICSWSYELVKGIISLAELKEVS